MKCLPLLCLTLLLAGCQQVPAAQAATQPAALSVAPPAAPSEGETFAQARCGGCHAVGKQGWSPRSAAPAFPVIVNHEGLTAETLSTWLRGAHNYPDEMDFYLGDRDVDRLVGYMMTLKDPNYRRPPD